IDQKHGCLLAMCCIGMGERKTRKVIAANMRTKAADIAQDPVAYLLVPFLLQHHDDTEILKKCLLN
ncbi:hypothetical protein KIPB_017151, partial [Kipferlia bialata]